MGSEEGLGWMETAMVAAQSPVRLKVKSQIDKGTRAERWGNGGAVGKRSLQVFGEQPHPQRDQRLTEGDTGVRGTSSAKRRVGWQSRPLRGDFW